MFFWVQWVPRGMFSIDKLSPLCLPIALLANHLEACLTHPDCVAFR